MSDKPTKKLWYFFDEIRCINLVSREDRYESSKSIFDKYEIPVKYFKANKHPKGGEYGCFDSHIKVIKEAYNNGAERVLIFEDDINATNYLTQKNLKRAINFMKCNKDWDLFYLGAYPYILWHRSERTKHDGIYKLRSIGTHCYVVNRSAMKKLMNLKYERIPIDIYLVNHFHKSYALYPMLFTQNLKLDSDLKSNDNFDGRSIYHWTEVYAYYINYPLIVFLPLLIAIIAWFVCGMQYHYHYLCLISLIFALLIFAILFWGDQKCLK